MAAVVLRLPLRVRMLRVLVACRPHRHSAFRAELPIQAALGIAKLVIHATLLRNNVKLAHILSIGNIGQPIRPKFKLILTIAHVVG